MGTIILPKTEHPITGDVYVDRLVEYARKHDYPQFHMQKVGFANMESTAVCNSMDIEEVEYTIAVMEHELGARSERAWYEQGTPVYEYDKVETFDSGIYAVKKEAHHDTYYIAFDEHFYILNF